MPTDHTTPLRSVRIPRPIWNAAKERAARERRSVSDLVRDGLTNYLETPLAPEWLVGEVDVARTDELAERYGGSMQSYIPTRRGVPLLLKPTLAMNRGLPDRICVGESGVNENAATVRGKAAVAEGHELALWVHTGAVTAGESRTKLWEHWADVIVTKFDTSPEGIRQAEIDARERRNPAKVAGVLRLDLVRDHRSNAARGLS